MEKPVVAYQCYGTPLRNKKKWSSNTHKNMDETQKLIWSSRKVQTLMTGIRSLVAWASGLGSDWLQKDMLNFQGDGTGLYYGCHGDFTTVRDYPKVSDYSFEWILLYVNDTSIKLKSDDGGFLVLRYLQLIFTLSKILTHELCFFPHHFKSKIKQ